MSRKKHKKNDMYVVIDENFGEKARFLGNRVFPGLSAASCWCEKHYPDKADDLHGNFTFRCMGERKLVNLLVTEMTARLPENDDKYLFLSMVRSLMNGKGFRVLTPTEKKAKLERELRLAKEGNKKAIHSLAEREKWASGRAAASREFANQKGEQKP